ncbi:MAG: AlwI family type II restriction endonuclease, partial [Nanoarchaeota archaeon]|nr:AlwI family type II restriction endonuclease [Nanoarchaeota archaeon]
ITKPKLPWDNLDSLKEIAKTIILEVKSLEKEISKELLKKKDYLKLDLEELKIYIEELRNYRRRLQEEIEHDESQDVKNVRDYIEILDKNIYGMEERPLVLEKYVTLGLNALNDALRIKPNYPVGDDNEPTNTAPAGKPDIECFYEEYNSICEVTLLKDRSQWFNEGQPVMRHLREFEEENSEKETYCLFIAPSLHVDTLETFWMAINYGYKGKKQKIIPITLNQFVKMLKVLLAMKEKGERFTRDHLLKLYISLLDLRGIENSDQWVNEIYNRLNKWGKVLTNGRAN